jgi:ABC-type uncharacterized transport system substrate-binding protein
VRDGCCEAAIANFALSGYAEDHNLAIEYRRAEGEFTRLPEMAADVVSCQVSAIAAVSGTPSGLAAKAATSTIPIVFAMASDPVEFGLVTSLSRPGANVTGATFYTVLLGAKRLELLRELVPRANTLAVFAKTKNPVNVTELKDVEAAAHRSLQKRHAKTASLTVASVIRRAPARCLAVYRGRRSHPRSCLGGRCWSNFGAPAILGVICRWLSRAI